MNVRSVLLAATILAVPAAAMAQPISGVYVGLGTGFDIVNQLSPNGNLSGWQTGKLQSRGGWIGVGSVGWGFGNGLRAEVEGNYRQNSLHVTNASFAGGGGTFKQYGVMVNAFYDFYGLVPWMVPYVGGGVGYIWNNVTGTIYSTTLASQVSGTASNQVAGSGAGQAIVGAAFPLGVPGLSLTAEFRFMGEFTNASYNVVARQGNNVAYGSAKLSAPTNESFLIGLRYAFNAAPAPMPAPAPAAAPAPAPARTYLVFFDWDKADLSARAHQIIAEAAQNSTKVQVTRIEVNGYADRTGTAQYNMVLSRKRADNVAAELVKDGVPKNIISIQAFGDTHLLVPTGPGVREPQNRRVEIILK
jgi:OmpA-OmpF porin, OOP family